ncbi:MAG: DEAD/DEAH box helicase [Anaerolineales bacterium]|nr:DEAD/DEAH box helicase [Anaerolineales bacterium]
MDNVDTISVPEQGQLVEVRQRRYVVSEVIKSSLPPTTLPGGVERPQHLIALTSVEDDALGEELEVIWELEPGAHAYDQVVLPEPTTGFDSPLRLDAFLDAVRWGAASSADVRSLQAPFRSGIDIEDYQLDPLVRAIQMPRVNLLIADDVGLGKTVEAGLVIQELIVRGRARTVMIVCPAGLQIHWRDQMREKFGLEFRIVDSELMKALRRSRGIHVNPWAHFPRLITSIDFLKRDRPMRLFRETVPGEVAYPRRYDILVVDEAHNVAPSGIGHFAIDSQRTQAIRALSPHFEHNLFLTATPHNGYLESFTALLELLDDQRFARSVRPDKRQLDAVMVRRLKSELVDWAGNPRYPRRELAVIEVAYTEAERQAHRWLKEYSALRQKNAHTDEERFAAEFVLKLLKKRLFSSSAAFELTLGKHLLTLQKGAEPARAKPKGPVAGILRRQIAQVEEEYANDEEYETASEGAVDTASQAFEALSPRERKLLADLQSWAEGASYRADSKAHALLRWLKATLKPQGHWNDERVIIFTEYRATQKWLQTLLAAQGLAGDGRLMVLFGGMDEEERERIKAAFQASPEQSPVRILLATDAASEGIDLQNYCHRLIHYEIPWNPNRMEQRNGRIDRHGQQHNPLIFHFVSQGYQQKAEVRALDVADLDADLEFLVRAAHKVEQIREDLGKVGPVIAQQVEEAMLGKRARLDTQLAEDEAQAARRMLRFERDLRDQIQKHFEQLQETRHTLKLSPENVQRVVEIALQIADQPPLIPVAEGAWAGKAFHLPALRGSWAACTEGLAHPHSKEIRPVVFDHALAKGRDDVVLAHLNHRLVSMALRLLRAEVWSPEGRRGLHRVTAQTVPNHTLDSPAVIAHARLVVIGGEHRLHEEIITAGGVIRGGRFNRLNVGQTQETLAAGTGKPVSQQTQAQLMDVWPKVETSLVAALEARMQDRLTGMRRLLEEREAKEVSDITSILQELKASIERELQEIAKPVQLPLFSDNEREQLTRNVDALRRRLQQIPDELDAETRAIRARYVDPQPRMFPVAVTFLVPERFG